LTGDGYGYIIKIKMLFQEPKALKEEIRLIEKKLKELETKTKK